MNISGISSQGWQRVNTLLGEVGRSIDPKSHAKTTVSDVEAKRIVQAFEKLEPAEKAEVSKALQQLMQQDVFTVSDKARGTFAQALGVPTQNLEPTAPLSSAKVRSVMQQSLQALTRPVNIDAKQFGELRDGLKDAPKGIGDFLMTALKSASEDGVIKLEPEARKGFTKEYATREGDNGALKWMENRFGENLAKKMPPLALSMLSNPPFFEEILAALMITLVTETNKEVLDDQLAIDQVLKDDQNKNAQKKAGAKADAKKEIQNATGETAKPGDTKPDVADPNKPATGPDGKKPSRLESTKGKLEAVVSSIDARMKDGSISLDDAKAIVGKLERFHPKDPVTKLLAEAMGTAMQHSPTTRHPQVKERLAPIADWVQRMTGKTDFPPPKGISSDKPLARALMESDKIEQRLAGFLVDAFIDRPAPGGAQGDAATAMEKFKPVLQEVLQEAAPSEAAKPKVGTQEQMFDKFQGLVDNRDKLPPGAIEKTIANTVENVAKDLPQDQKDALKTAFKTAFDALPKTGKPTPEQVKDAFGKATGKAIDHVMDKNVEKGDGHELLDEKITKAKQNAYERITESADRGKELSPDEQQKVLGEELAKQQVALLKEAKAAGMDDKQLDALGQAFARQGVKAAEQLKTDGKLEPTNPEGMGKSDDPTASDDTRSRQLMFEKLKFKMNMLSEMMQAMSNVLNTLHQNAENAIRAIR